MKSIITIRAALRRCLSQEFRVFPGRRLLHTSSVCHGTKASSLVDTLSIPESQQKKIQREDNAEKTLRNISDQQKELLNALQIEIEILHTTSQVEITVDKIQASEWVHMLTDINTMSERLNYIKYLNQKFLLIKKRTIQKELKEKYLTENIQNENHGCPILVTEPLNSQQISLERKNRASHALILGNPLVIDLDYDMTEHEERKVLENFRFCYSAHTYHMQPFNLLVTGLRNRPVFNKHLESGGSLCKLMVNFYQESLTELLPLNDLIYLSSNAKCVSGYEGNKIHVIGGLPPNSCGEHVRDQKSYVKAKTLNIRCVSFPIPQYFRYTEKFISKDLTLNKAYQVMLDVNLHHDWKVALCSHLDPQRFLPREHGQASVFSINKSNISSKKKSTKRTNTNRAHSLKPDHSRSDSVNTCKNKHRKMN